MTGDAQQRRRWWGWLRWPLALAVMAWLIVPNLEGLQEVVAAGVLWRWLLAAATLRLLAMGLACLRWRLLLVGQQIPVSESRIFRMVCTGYVCNFLLPGTWGGDIARAGLIASDSPERRMRGAATVPLDRGLGLLAFVLVGAIAGLCRWSQIPPGLLRLAVIALVVLAAAGVSLLGGLLLLPMPRRPRASTKDGGSNNEPIEDELVSEVRFIVEKLNVDSAEDTLTRRQRLGRELLFGLGLLRKSRSSVLVAFVLAVIGHMGLCLSLYCCLPAYPAAKVPATAIDHFWLVPAAEVPAALLPVPGGVGAREGTLALLYGSLTRDAALSQHYTEIGVIVAATFSLVCVLLAVLIGLGLALSGFGNSDQYTHESPERSASL